MYFPNSVKMTQSSWLGSSSSKVKYCKEMSSLVKNLCLEMHSNISVMIGKGYCLHIIAALSEHKSVI